MPYRALAIAIDGTLLPGAGGAPPEGASGTALAALARLRQSGRRVVLVTGRGAQELEAALPDLPRLCDVAVCEGGGVLHDPQRGDARALADPPPPALAEALRRKGVAPVEVGRVAVSTRIPFEKAAIDTIRELGLDLRVSFGGERVTILPPGRDKASAVMAVLDRFAIAPDEVVAIGVGEDDHALLRHCGRAVAVADAVASLREDADHVTAGRAGAGAVEEIERMLAAGPVGAPPPDQAPPTDAAGRPTRVS